MFLTHSLFILLLLLPQCRAIPDIISSHTDRDTTYHRQLSKRHHVVPHIPSIRTYIFVNPKSGGRKAGDILHLPNPYVYKGIAVYHLNVSGTLREDKSALKAFRRDVSKTPENVFTRVLAAGGDGTVMGCVNLLRKEGVDLNKVVIGHIPYGTGNDFARVTGWGVKAPSIPGHNNKGINDLIEQWLQAEISDFDLWRVAFTVHKTYGSFWNVINRMDSMLTRKGRKAIAKIDVPMMNYFSMGLESKIGRDFERRRGQSQFWNKLRYGWEALRQIGKEVPTVKDYLSNVTETSTNELIFHTAYCEGQSGHRDEDGDDDDDDDDDEDPKGERNRILRGRGDKGIPDDKACSLPADRLLYDDAVSLDVLNIPSFAGGNDIWSRADHWWNRPAVSGRGKDKLKGAGSFSDGKLELLTYKDMLSFYLDVAFKIGNARRLYQGSGPFEFNFKKSTPTKRYYTYMQVDGEYYKVFNPDKAVVKFDRKIRVMLGKQKA
ncbi:hypothetical protein FOZ62_026702 [Perkinsus olseni]|uniref:diacylglycerol kinase (ATP) n=1 Tax=Perkinsus olseni TaxID=32597 RepID=A0A7J6TDK6_PEROL|nr:hypothetical protein FOZ62_026702 [Perkinsus olseni]